MGTDAFNSSMAQWVACSMQELHSWLAEHGQVTFALPCLMRVMTTTTANEPIVLIALIGIAVV
jgi:hypothetical protein